MTDKIIDELSPCPFCGSTDIVPCIATEDAPEDDYTVICRECLEIYGIAGCHATNDAKIAERVSM